jgi:hypothetical protein
LEIGFRDHPRCGIEGIVGALSEALNSNLQPHLIVVGVCDLDASVLRAHDNVPTSEVLGIRGVRKHPFCGVTIRDDAGIGATNRQRCARRRLVAAIAPTSLVARIGALGMKVTDRRAEDRGKNRTSDNQSNALRL